MFLLFPYFDYRGIIFTRINFFNIVNSSNLTLTILHADIDRKSTSDLLGIFQAKVAMPNALSDVGTKRLKNSTGLPSVLLWMITSISKFWRKQVLQRGRWDGRKVNLSCPENIYEKISNWIQQSPLKMCIFLTNISIICILLFQFLSVKSNNFTKYYG